jgi:type III restriction enzyme
MKELRLLSGYDIFYGKVKEFTKYYLFDSDVDIEDLNTLRNLSELGANKTIVQKFNTAMTYRSMRVRLLICSPGRQTGSRY